MALSCYETRRKRFVTSIAGFITIKGLFFTFTIKAGFNALHLHLY